MIKKAWLLAIFLCGCASLDRGCTGCMAKNFGSDWIVVQLSAVDGKPIRCWKLHDASLSSESQSDGVYWKDTESGNMVHIAGFYNYVQVKDKRWDAAFKQLGLTEGYCEKIALSPWDVPKEPAKPSEDPAMLKSLADQCCDAMVRLRYQLDGCREANKKR